MLIQLDEKLVQQLEALAYKQKRAVNQIVQELVEHYIQKQTEDEQLRSEIRDIMQEQAWLLNELAKR